mgnify:CR=1 FL=1
MRVGLVAASPQVGEKFTNLKKMEVYIEQADADLLIFGELFLTGFGEPNQLRAYAEKTDGKSIKKAKRLAKKYKNTSFLVVLSERGIKFTIVLYLCIQMEK